MSYGVVPCCVLCTVTVACTTARVVVNMIMQLWSLHRRWIVPARPGDAVQDVELCVLCLPCCDETKAVTESG